MVTRKLLLLLSCVLLGLGACYTEVEDPVVIVDDSNEAMNEAMETAQKTFGQFVENWKAMPNDGVSVKFAHGNRDHGGMLKRSG